VQYFSGATGKPERRFRPGRLEEINRDLASPPDFDLSRSDRLGLFIAGRLAARHGITVTLRQSARLHEPFSAELRRAKERMNALGKAEIEAVFAAELHRLAGQRRIRLTSALVGVGFWQFWESLRTDVGASPEQAQEIVAGLFTATLTAPA
jgi:hypothetical protein